jgi:chromosome segregation ATPase
MKVSSGSIEKMQSEILNLQSQIDDRRESLNELELKKAHITSEISQLQAEYKEQENYRVTFEALSQSYKDVVESVNKCEELKKDLEASIIEAQSKIDEMDLAGVEEDDEEHYKEVHHLLRDFKSKLEDCIKYKDTYSKRESDIKTELNKIQVKIIDASTILDKIKTATCNLDQINAQCNNMVSALESLYNELTPLKTDVNVAINAVEDLEVKNTINTSNVIDIFSTAGYSLNETRVLNFLIASVYYDKHKRYDTVVDNAGKNTSEPEFIIASLKSLLGV